MRDVTFGVAEVDRMRIRDFSRPIIAATDPPIVLSAAARGYELKSVHFSLLPSFYGLPDEDALNFMREFCLMVQSFPLKGLTEDELKMKFFSHTLKDRAKSWLMLLQPNSLANWDAICDKFITRYYLYSKTQELRMQIVQFAQMPNELFHDAWDRFRSLQQQCPHHHFPLEMFYQTFYDGLERNFQYMVDNAARGGIGNCTAQDLSNIFEVLASSSQQKGASACKVQLHGNYGHLEYGANVWQREANVTDLARVHVNATYAFKRQGFDSFPQDCAPSWRPNLTFKWQSDDDDVRTIWVAFTRYLGGFRS